MTGQGFYDPYAVGCPTCHVEEQDPCIGTRGRPRRSCHALRVSRARATPSALSTYAAVQARRAALPVARASTQGIVYFIRAGATGAVKIGWTEGAGRYDVERRRMELQVGNAEDLVVIGWRAAGRDVERQLHAQLRRHRLRGEWHAPHADVLSEAAA